MERKKDTRQLILEKSRQAFLKKDIFNTVMSDIALSADLSVRTIYRYFDTKEDLVYEITIDLLNEWNSYQINVFNKLNGSGIDKLEIFLKRLIDYMSKKQDVMRYLAEFDFYFSDETTLANVDSMRRFDEVILISEDLIHKIIKEGINDKSIKDGLDIKLTVATISNVLWSFGQRIAIRGKIIEKESGFDGITLINNQVDIYIKNIKEV